MFQWLVLVGEHCRELSSIFNYELCSFPSALSESSSLPLQANKPILANALWKSIHESQREPSEDVQYLLDGGALLHRQPWPQGSIYDDVCHMYVNHVQQRYCTDVPVFDGYTNELSTKDAIHLIRAGTCSGATVHFTGDMLILSKKDEFLANKENKQRFCNQRAREYKMCWRVPSRMLMCW